MVFFSYRTNTGTKHESPAGDQFWKFSRQSSIFGRIGDKWVAISNPEYSVEGKQRYLANIIPHRRMSLLEDWLN